MNEKLPNFLLVGGAKCGSTSIYNYLRQSPQIFLPEKKEPLYLMSSIYRTLSKNDPRRYISERNTVFSFEEYIKLFEGVTNECAIGEASATYLYYHSVAIPNIKELLGDVKIIILLRNPVDRAYSSYSHLVRYKAESLSFEDFIEKEEERINENWDILNFPLKPGLYYNQVKSYLNNFNQVKICLLEDLKNNPECIIKELYKFLAVDYRFVPDLGRIYNKSGIQKKGILKVILEGGLFNKGTRTLLTRIIDAEKRSKIRAYLQKKNSRNINIHTRNSLKIFFREDILKLQDLIDRDLTDWL